MLVYTKSLPYPNETADALLVDRILCPPGSSRNEKQECKSSLNPAGLCVRAQAASGMQRVRGDAFQEIAHMADRGEIRAARRFESGARLHLALGGIGCFLAWLLLQAPPPPAADNKLYMLISGLVPYSNSIL